MAGLYEIWRDPDRAEDDPDRFRWTCTVLTTQAEDAVGHIHDRMPLMVERDRWGAWLDPDVSGRDDLLSLLVPAAPGSARGLPGLHRRQQRPQQRPGAGRADPGRRRPRVSAAMTSLRGPSPRRTARAGWSSTPPAPRHGDPRAQPRRRQRHRGPRPGGAGAAPSRARGSRVALFEQPWRVAGRKIATAAAHARRRRLSAAVEHARGRGRRSWSAAAPPGPAPRPAAPAGSAPSAAWRSPSRCTRPGGPRSPGSTS